MPEDGAHASLPWVLLYLFIQLLFVDSLSELLTSFHLIYSLLSLLSR